MAGKEYYGTNAFQDAGADRGREQEDDYVRDYTITKKLREDLESKFSMLEDQANDKSGQDLVNLRIRQLSIVKILVRIHGGDQNLLVRGHADLGQAYNNFKCYDQAYEHLSVALKKNEPDLETERGQEYQLFILKLLSINRLHQGKPDEALFYIEEAENICLSNQGSPLAVKDLAEVKRYHGEYFTAKGLYADAIECYQEVARISKDIDKENSEGEARAYKAMYKVYMKMGDLQQALETLQRTLKLYEEVENCENKMETLIGLYMEKLELLRTCTLDNEEDRDEHIKDCYIQIKELNIRQYGEKDKRSLKALRNLVILLTRKQQYDDALANLETVEKVESELFGLKSKQIAKTYSLKGTLYLRNGDKRKAKQYFQKSEEIYKELGDEEGAKKTHEKLAMLNQGQ